MKYTTEDRKVQIRGEASGVQGEMKVEILFPPQPNARLFANVWLEPGASLDYHEHHGECEIYYILEGEGAYQDNENVYQVVAGDVTVCDSGNGHAMKNTGKQPLRWVALIYSSKSPIG